MEAGLINTKQVLSSLKLGSTDQFCRQIHNNSNFIVKTAIAKFGVINSTTEKYCNSNEIGSI